jgi:hypothetical protein
VSSVFELGLAWIGDLILLLIVVAGVAFVLWLGWCIKHERQHADKRRDR